MDFDLSKENIQPLRGGRNISQLEVALQAQSDEERFRELMQQKEAFENAIRTYEGDDPLQTWFTFITWVEQSYPKHGYEGNLINLLEDCLSKFEHDVRYVHDRRFCKLWIKYIDMQPNPVELFHMLHARGICRSCSDLYRAWAYYHEVAGDYKSADAIFQLGMSELAQPYEELVTAQCNLIYAVGQQAIRGSTANSQRLEEQRKALTMLSTYNQGKLVTNFRIPSSTNPGVVSSSDIIRNDGTDNAKISVYQDRENNTFLGGEAAPPISIITVVKRQHAPKENTIKPGVWTNAALPIKKIPISHRTPAFTVHEDVVDLHAVGIMLPKEYFPVTHEDYSNWCPPLAHFEPEDTSKISMYPKSKVYGSSTEISIEEIKAEKYKLKMSSCNDFQKQVDISDVSSTKQLGAIRKSIEVNNRSIQQQQHLQQQNLIDISNNDNSGQFETQPRECINSPFQLNKSNCLEEENRVPIGFNSSAKNFNIFIDSHCSPQLQQQQQQQQSFPILPSIQPDRNVNLINNFTTSNESPARCNNLGNNVADLWRLTTDDDSNSESLPPMKGGSHFAIYEDDMNPEAASMKTSPFSVLNCGEFAETGSRSGLDVASAAQPMDSAMKVVSEIYSPINLDQINPQMTNSNFLDLNMSCNTQLFSVNLNAMQVSTPQSKRSEPLKELDAVEEKQSKKMLFAREPETKNMSTIFEENSKDYRSSSSTGSSKSTLNNSRKEAMTVISEEDDYNFNLSQNLKANAALRSSLLGNLMECETNLDNNVVAVTEPLPTLASAPTPIVPLNQAPSDPFKSTVTDALLRHVSFPNRNISGYVEIYSNPRFAMKKEPCRIGNDRYLLEKVLGRGTYGQVFKATDVRTKENVALKIQKPPNKWEFYICREIEARLAKHPMKYRFMQVPVAYFNDQMSILVSQYSRCGSLLDVVNAVKTKTGKTLKESYCVYFTMEMLNIVQLLHKANIIHADVKPDNFLVFIAPDQSISLQLIDFGCSIDMSLFPPGTTFLRRVTTENFVCCEMRDGRPWSFHTDLFCIAASAHVLLFDKYIEVQKKEGYWSITRRFTRYMSTELWNTFFTNLLNQQEGPADPEPLTALFNAAFYSADRTADMRYLTNILKDR